MNFAHRLIFWCCAVHLFSDVVDRNAIASHCILLALCREIEINCVLCFNIDSIKCLLIVIYLCMVNFWSNFDCYCCMIRCAIILGSNYWALTNISDVHVFRFSIQFFGCIVEPSCFLYIRATYLLSAQFGFRIQLFKMNTEALFPFRLHSPFFELFKQQCWHNQIAVTFSNCKWTLLVSVHSRVAAAQTSF